jgi:hypothetical protein
MSAKPFGWLLTQAVLHALSLELHPPAQLRIATHSVLPPHASVVVQHEALRHAVQASSLALFVQLVGTWTAPPLLLPPPSAVVPPVAQKSPQLFPPPAPPSAPPPVPVLEVLHATATSALAREMTTASPVRVELWWRIPWI